MSHNDDDSSVDSVPSDTPLSALGQRKYCTIEADNYDSSAELSVDECDSPNFPSTMPPLPPLPSYVPSLSSPVVPPPSELSVAPPTHGLSYNTNDKVTHESTMEGMMDIITDVENVTTLALANNTVYEPPQSTLEYILNGSNDRDSKLGELEWLTEELTNEIQEWKPHITNEFDSDISPNGGTVVNVQRLSTAFSSVFVEGRKFFNLYQAFSVAHELANMWGFQVKTSGKNFICVYGGKDRSNEYKSQVDESKRRKRSQPLSACGCLFKIVTGFVPNENQKKALREKTIKSYDRKNTVVQVLTGCCFEHNGHDLDKASLIVAKKSSGAYSLNKLPRALMETLVSVVAFSSGESRQIRKIVRQFVPEDLPVSQHDVSNFRAAARRAYLAGDITLATMSDNGRSTKFSGLDGDSDIRLCSDEATKRAREILLSTMQNSSDTWVAIRYFNNLASRDPNFAYEVAEDDQGRPIGVWWMTGEMKRAWFRYGDSLYLDSMKRQMNSLHWPYIGPVVLTSELNVQVVCECIIIEESLPAYAFVLNNLFKNGASRPKETLKIIFGDCLLTEGLLEMIGLSKMDTHMFWDHFHLQTFVWPTALGKELYSRISHDAIAMLNSESMESFKTACEAITRVLLPYPDKYAYFKEGYMDKPERFAAFMIDQVKLSLCRRGDTPAESNHSSINTHLGGGGVRQLAEQVHLLLERQHEIVTTRHNSNTKYHTDCIILARQMKNDASNAEAIQTLSSFGYNNWCEQRLRAKEYQCVPGEDGSNIIKWMGSNAVKSHTILKNGRCTCSTQVAMGFQCRHEICMLGGRFVKELFADRHFQERALPRSYYMHQTTEQSITNAVTISDANDSIEFSAAGEDEEHPDVDSDDFSTHFNFSADAANDQPSLFNHQSMNQDRCTSTYSSSNACIRPSLPKVTYNGMIEQAKIMAHAALADQHMATVMFAALIQLTNIARDGSADNVQMDAQEIVQIANTALKPRSKGCKKLNNCLPIPARANTTVTPRQRIRSGVEGPKPALKKSATCRFCGDTKHNIQGCHKRTENGRRHISSGAQYDRLVSVLSQGRAAVPIPVELKSSKQVLSCIPPRTNWLVIKGVYHVLEADCKNPPMEDVVLYVDCLLSGDVELIENMHTDCLVRMCGAHSWFGKTGGNATKTLSRVFVESGLYDLVFSL